MNKQNDQSPDLNELVKQLLILMVRNDLSSAETIAHSDGYRLMILVTKDE